MQCPTNASARPLTILENTTVSSWTSDTSQAGYSYHADITNDEITEDMSATVIFNNAQASSGNYAPFCITGNGYVRIFSKVNTSITIPIIRVAGTLNYYSISGTLGNDLKPVKIVNGKAVAVTNDLVSTTGNQTIAGTKTFSSTITGNISGSAGSLTSGNKTIDGDLIITNNHTLKFGTSGDGIGHNTSPQYLICTSGSSTSGGVSWCNVSEVKAGSAGFADNLWTTSHNGSWYFESNWDGSYFQTQCRDAGTNRLPINVGRANNSGQLDGRVYHWGYVDRYDDWRTNDVYHGCGTSNIRVLITAKGGNSSAPSNGFKVYNIDSNKFTIYQDAGSSTIVGYWWLAIVA